MLLLLLILLLALTIAFITYENQSNANANTNANATYFRFSNDLPQGWNNQDKVNSCISSWQSGSKTPPSGCDFNCKAGDPSCFCVKGCNNDSFHFTYDCSSGMTDQPPCPF